MNRVEIPPEMVPKDAQVEIAAKVFHGYHAGAGYAGMDESASTASWAANPCPDPSARASPEAASGRRRAQGAPRLSIRIDNTHLHASVSRSYHGPSARSAAARNRRR